MRLCPPHREGIRMRYEGTTALVTGASSGIGAEFARRLARRGADVVLVARRADACESLAAEIKRETGRAAHVLPFDLTTPRGGYLLADAAAARGIGVDTVVNCAGAGLTRPFMDSTERQISDQLRLDIDATVDVSHAFLPQLIRSGRGALINFGSFTGYLPVPNMAVYAASKAFVIRFTEALAYELRDSRLTVLAVSPGPTRTEFFTSSGTSTDGLRLQTPDQVCTTAFRALDRRRPPVSVISGAANRSNRRLADLLPRRTVMRLMESKAAE
ncbi:short-chain dehydrogenase [Virgisporangium aliadipatigenens]|uniref:Short-chain dehydrogenase n=1 Tax=Virgisporangium aliadipatigenens TaxID=741659 RepID=A0A8J3YEE6_9ACTN|nr:SDR family oxidoreductase [Virgisporangium aliadipatigenens]GIJ43594.1 short-chain dehydrogenase [Virgisporangium aliadipatigenens]